MKEQPTDFADSVVNLVDAMKPAQKHTPGPWKYHWETHAKDWAVCTDNRGNIIANINTETGPDILPLVSTKMPAQANAALIAAAPDLLEACEAAKKYLEPDLVEPGAPVFWRLVAAIAKAQG